MMCEYDVCESDVSEWSVCDVCDVCEICVMCMWCEWSVCDVYVMCVRFVWCVCDVCDVCDVSDVCDVYVTCMVSSPLYSIPFLEASKEGMSPDWSFNILVSSMDLKHYPHHKENKYI